MCTAINFNGYFGRTLDYECGFGEEATLVRRDTVLHLRHRKSITTAYSVGGMARVENGYPLFFDAMNEKGLAMAGLNFVGNAYYPRGDDGDIAVFELIPYVLSQAATVKEAEGLIMDTRIVDTPFSRDMPTASLHWLIGDRENTLTVESTENGLSVYTNPTGVLTNNPPFPYQLAYLNNFLNLTPLPAENRFSHSMDIEPVSRGMGAIGLPGDWSSPSRFVRAAFVRENATKEKSAEHFFRIMSSVSVPKGCMILENGDSEYTRYTSCMDLENGIYYFSRYENHGIKALSVI